MSTQLVPGRLFSLSKNEPIYFIHAAIVVFFMFGFSFIPPFGGITEIGMGVLGVFLGVLWGWTFCEQVWPSLLSLIAIGFTGYTTVSKAFVNGFGHSNVILVFSVLVFICAIDHAGVTKLLAYKVINLKIGRGRPWILSFLIVYGAWLMSAFAGLFAAIVLMWSLFYQICDIYKIPKGKYTQFMVAGICFACIMGGGQAFPWKPPVVMFLGAYTGVGGSPIDPLNYTIFIWITHFIYCVVWTLAGRFIVRPDVTAISKVDKALVESSGPLTRYQKMMIGFFCAFLIGLFWPSFMPANWGITVWLKAIGTSGVAILLTIVLLICKFNEGLNIKEMIYKGVNWDVIFLVASVMIVANAIGDEVTGVSVFINNIVTPIFAGKGTIVFLILVTLLPAIITGFANNLVVGMIFIPISYNFAVTAGINHAALAVCLCSLCSIAMLTAAGCAPAAMLHGNSEWITSKQAAFYGVIGLVVVWGVTFAFLPLAFMMF